MSGQNRRIAGRIVRNLVVTLAVTAIFGFKAAEVHSGPVGPAKVTLAAR